MVVIPENGKHKRAESPKSEEIESGNTKKCKCFSHGSTPSCVGCCYSLLFRVLSSLETLDHSLTASGAFKKVTK